MPREPRFLTSRDDMTLADEPAFACLLRALCASVVSHSAKQSQFAEAGGCDNCCLGWELGWIRAAWAAGKTKPMEGVSSSTGEEPGRSGPDVRNKANLPAVDSAVTGFEERGYVSRGGGDAVENKAKFAGRRVGKITPYGVTTSLGGFL